MKRRRTHPAVQAWFRSLVAARQDPDNMIYIATLQSELEVPHVHSETRKCSNCKRKVWVDVRMARLADAAKAISCGPCISKASGRPLQAIVLDELNRHSESEI